MMRFQEYVSFKERVVMHELPVTESIVRIAVEEAERHRVKKVNEIKLMVGELSGLVPECIQYYFDIISKGTRVEGAKIRINKIPITMKCQDCGFSGSTDEFVNNECPKCLSKVMKMVGGNEFYIDSMEVEDCGD
jgi:hydrogenase nickel incorporation protein HypA/HybF